MDKHSGTGTLSFSFCLSAQWRSVIKKRNWSKFFPFRADHILEGSIVHGNRRDFKKIVSLRKNDVKHDGVVSNVNKLNLLLDDMSNFLTVGIL